MYSLLYIAPEIENHGVFVSLEWILSYLQWKHILFHTIPPQPRMEQNQTLDSERLFCIFNSSCYSFIIVYLTKMLFWEHCCYGLGIFLFILPHVTRFTFHFLSLSVFPPFLLLTCVPLLNHSVFLRPVFSHSTCLTPVALVCSLSCFVVNTPPDYVSSVASLLFWTLDFEEPLAALNLTFCSVTCLFWQSWAWVPLWISLTTVGCSSSLGRYSVGNLTTRYLTTRFFTLVSWWITEVQFIDGN